MSSALPYIMVGICLGVPCVMFGTTVYDIFFSKAHRDLRKSKLP